MRRYQMVVGALCSRSVCPGCKKFRQNALWGTATSLSRNRERGGDAKRREVAQQAKRRAPVCGRNQDFSQRSAGVCGKSLSSRKKTGADVGCPHPPETLWVASGDDRIGGNSQHSSVSGVAAGMRRLCSLMGQGAARDERMNACRESAFSTCSYGT
jgi:hypothetical protein